MIYAVLIVLFLIVVALSLIILKLIKRYFRLCKAIEKDSIVPQKTVRIFKGSLFFFSLLGLIFLLLFFIF